MKNLFHGKNQYKGNLHMHTTVSDGTKSPEYAISIYKEAGYDFISITDHRVTSKGGEYEGMLLIPGAEWDNCRKKGGEVFHILSIGTESDLGLSAYYKLSEPGKCDELSPESVVARIKKAGGLAILAHPNWSLMDPADIKRVEGIDAVEIYNSVSAPPWNADRADSSLYFDLWGTKGILLNCTASDDSHWYSGEETKSYTMVFADELSNEAVIAAIKSGNAYASRGPRFESVSYDEKKIEIKCSEDVERIIVYSDAVWVNPRVFDHPCGKAVYDISPNDSCIRIELIDKEGRKAWTGTFGIKE